MLHIQTAQNIFVTFKVYYINIIIVETFSNEDVTKGFRSYYNNERFIHAWGIDKCIEYLKRVKESILG